MGDLEKVRFLIEKIVAEISAITKCYEKGVVVAFSGGIDSSAAAILCKEALGPEHVELVHVTYGPYSYSQSFKIVSDFAKNYGFKLRFVESSEQEKVWRFGPSCNMCTRIVKMGTVLRYAGGRLVVTGSNVSDSWGQTGLKVFNGMYAPLGELGKAEIKAILQYFGVEVRRIGENNVREGCKLKHLLKPMTNPEYHGLATSLANELILKHFPTGNEVANVKIVGPLSKNIAVVNLKPFRQPDELLKELKEIDVIDEVFVADRPLILTVVANPSIYRVPSSRFWIEEGRLKPEFAVPIKVEWHESKNNKLRTFHVVEVREWTNYETEKGIRSESFSVSLGTSSEMRCYSTVPFATRPTPTS